MTPTTTTRDQLVDQAAKAEADARDLRERLAAINCAEQNARRAAELAHYSEAHDRRSREYREARDECKTELDRLAGADTLDIGVVWKAFVALRDSDARAGAMHTHASMLETVRPTERDHLGVHRPRPPQVSALYERSSFAAWIDQILAARTSFVRSRHIDELRTEVSSAVDRAGAQARAAAERK